jgi:hypothetical protein
MCEVFLLAFRDVESERSLLGGLLSSMGCLVY